MIDDGQYHHVHCDDVCLCNFQVCCYHAHIARHYECPDSRLMTVTAYVASRLSFDWFMYSSLALVSVHLDVCAIVVTSTEMPHKVLD